jgi:hypothetical protein
MKTSSPLFNRVPQIEEKYWAHRRGSETASEGTAASFVGSFRLTTLHSPAPPGEFPTGEDPFVEKEDEKHMKEQIMAPGIQGCLLLYGQLTDRI